MSFSLSLSRQRTLIMAELGSWKSLVPDPCRFDDSKLDGIYTISLIDGMRRSGLFKNCFFTLADEYMRKKMAEACMLRHYPEIVGNLLKEQLLLNNLTSFFVLESWQSAFEGEHVHDFEVGDSFLSREQYLGNRTGVCVRSVIKNPNDWVSKKLELLETALVVLGMCCSFLVTGADISGQHYNIPHRVIFSSSSAFMVRDQHLKVSNILSVHTKKLIREPNLFPKEEVNIIDGHDSPVLAGTEKRIVEKRLKFPNLVEYGGLSVEDLEAVVLYIAVPFTWIESDLKLIANPQMVKLHSFDTKIHKVDSDNLVSYKNNEWDEE
ncbi:hypothetical protein EZV62_025339 [Acer yangbiense]|uniref:Uncharacterized protein n=1 Tax=Acer yangbiense TaxID=1000413 RepID=A0A5C7GXI4_9ROSI|nr:hypothetical protein EZV62_025339 [Acer yangbiense]